MNRMSLPLLPAQTHIKSVYPWEQESFLLICHQLYTHAKNTGYEDSFDNFKDTLGNFFNTLTNLKFYEGSYEAIPLPNMEQSFKTAQRILEKDIVVKEIPYYETSNDAGGYTVIIG